MPFFPPSGPGTPTPVSERLRAMEDYLSRSTETYVYQSANTPLLIGSSNPTIVPLNTVLTNSAGLWSSGPTFVVPAGSEGDYIVRGRVVLLTSGTVSVAVEHNGNTILASTFGFNTYAPVASTHVGLSRGDTLRLTAYNRQSDPANTLVGGQENIYLFARRVV